MNRYIDNKFIDNRVTIGLEFKSKIFYYENLVIRAIIFDQIFSERIYYTNVPNYYYKRTDGIIITYDISNKGSFEIIKKMIEDIEIKAIPNVRKILIGNKCDKESEREVTEEEGKKLADEFNMNFFETSAKNDINVKEAFDYLIKDIINNNKDINKENKELNKDDDINKNNKCYK